jgi:hypothetical protein
MNTISKLLTVLIFFTLSLSSVSAQNIIPLDTVNWNINARSYVLENYKGKDAIYMQAGGITLKNTEFLNGTIEFDIYLKEVSGFPGVYFRIRDGKDGEQWYIRPHLSGKPDANQAAPLINGVSPWQLYFGKKYSFAYKYNYNNWTHVKLVVKGDKAQVFLDHSEKPNLSWNLFTATKAGGIMIRGGGMQAMHIANVKISHEEPELMNFNPIERKPIEDLVSTWEVSDAFAEKKLDNIKSLKSLISVRKWKGTIAVEEGTAANISRKIQLQERDANTVFAKIVIYSDKTQQKLFRFGYSDRVVAILNGNAIYKGTNRWRSRDYRYLGTIGLFDGVYLNLKKGKNELLMAVSEDFGGWLITGKFEDPTGVQVK